MAHGQHHHGHRAAIDMSPAVDAMTTDRSGRRAVFVSNLPLGVSEDDVRSNFELRAGTVESLKIWKDHRGGQQFGLITFQFPLDAKRALASLHRTEFRGRILTLAFAR